MSNDISSESLQAMFMITEVCRGAPLQPCQHGGYQDPNSCDRCKCPDGFSGPYCQNVAPSKNGKLALCDVPYTTM